MFMLFEQRDTLQRSLSKERSAITSVENTIEKLETAVRAIESDRLNAISTDETITNMVINPSIWRGLKQQSYQEHSDTYTQQVDALLVRIQEVQTEVDNELQRQKDHLLLAQTSLANIETSLASVNKQISQAKEG